MLGVGAYFEIEFGDAIGGVRGVALDVSRYSTAQRNQGHPQFAGIVAR
jgi:hypothetical protein